MRRIIFTFLLISVPFLIKAQYLWDYGMSLGAANYLGEIGGDEKTRRDFVMDMKLGQTRWGLGGFGRYKFNNLLNFKGGLTYARIQGDDQLSTNRGRRGRNLSFRNDMIELVATTEVNFYQANDVGRSGRYRIDFRSYGFVGMGALYHSPKAEYQGKWVALQPLHTEGVDYNRITFTVPVGVGFYYTYKRKYRFGMEVGYRTTFTDYLDDVSTNYATKEQLNNDPLAIALANRRNEISGTDVPKPNNYFPGEKRGDPTHNDGYILATLNASYVIRGKGSFYRSKYNFVFGAKRKKRKTRAKF